MEVEGQITLDEWMQWKEDIRRKLKETAGNFVYIGCRLRQIRDSGMLDGAADIFEFAQREYGLSKSTTSRFIAVNERFADPYNPLLIKEEFENIGSSKLSEMLTLPDSECALITEKTTVKEIRDLKSFDKEAEKLENVEESMDAAVATSQQDAGLVPETEPDYTPLQRCIIDYFAEKQIMLDKALGQIREQQWKEAFETVNPSGYASSRKGLCFLFMYEWSRGVAYKLMTEPAPVNMNWEDFLKDVAEIYGQQSWEEFYRKQKEEPEAAQEKTEVPQGEMQEEPEQQEQGRTEGTQSETIHHAEPGTQKPDPEEQPRQQTIHSVEPSIPEPDPIPEEPAEEPEKPEAQEEEQLPGQDSIEEHEEWMPDEKKDMAEMCTRLKDSIMCGNWQEAAELAEKLVEEIKKNLEDAV